MQPQDVTRRAERSQDDMGGAGGVVGVEQAEAALVEHYPRLVRLSYLVLPPQLGKHRRVLTAHALAQRALPRGRGSAAAGAAEGSVPGPRRGAGTPAGPGYAYVRREVVRRSLEAARPARRVWPRRSHLPPLLPRVWGLRLFPHSGGVDELALDRRLSALDAPARAAYALRGLEGLTPDETRQVLAAAGVEDPHAALTEAGEAGSEGTAALLNSPEFDACSLLARPTDLMRRRAHGKAALVAAVALALCGALLGLPGEGRGPEGAAAPPYAQNPAGQAALDPGRLTSAPAAAWRTATRRDYAVWPARGGLVGDRPLLRRALAVWARPGAFVDVSATPGTPAGAPPGPPRLLYAGVVDRARVVVFYDGLRVVRYAESTAGGERAALDLARVDGVTGAEANAVVLDRADTNVRYLTAPWVRAVSVRDLLSPGAAPVALRRSAAGVTDPMPGPPRSGTCASWNVLQLRDPAGTRLMSDLGELVPAHLTAGAPGTAGEVAGSAGLADWAHTGCSLGAMRGSGVRSVNAWRYGSQVLPEDNGTASWLCTRGETWQGTGSRVVAQFLAPEHPAAAPAAQAEGSAACGARVPRVLAGVLWKAAGGRWYLLAGGSSDVARVTVSGDVRATRPGSFLAVPADRGARARLDGELADGTRLPSLR